MIRSTIIALSSKVIGHRTTLAGFFFLGVTLILYITRSKYSASSNYNERKVETGYLSQDPFRRPYGVSNHSDSSETPSLLPKNSYYPSDSMRDLIQDALESIQKEASIDDLNDVAHEILYDEVAPNPTEQSRLGDDMAECNFKHIVVVDVWKREHVSHECVKLKVVPPVPICLYPAQRDLYVSSYIRDTGLWEPHIVEKFQAILNLHPGMKVIDIGANIGQYSLIAANLGHKVIAVEPNSETIELLKTAIVMGNFQANVTVIQNAVTDVCGQSQVVPNNINPGDTRVIPAIDLIKSSNASDFLASNESYVQCITMNALTNFVNRGDELLVKMDIQGYENKVFQHAEHLFKFSNIAYIFMEWVLMRDFYVTDVHKSIEKTLVEETLDILKDKYVPFSLGSGVQLDPEGWFGWPEDVMWVLSAYI